MVNVHMQAQVKSSTERMLMALNAADMGAWDYDTAAQSFTLSPAAREHMGFGGPNHGDKLPLKTILEATHPSDEKLLQKAFEKAAADLRSFGVEFRLRGAGGVYQWVELRGRALSDGTTPPRHLVGVTLQDTGPA
jgi:PAS domain-containing protein